MMFIAVVLTLRHKWQYIDWVMGMLYNSVRANELRGKVKPTLIAMFEQYSKMGKGGGSISSSKENTSAISPNHLNT